MLLLIQFNSLYLIASDSVKTNKKSITIFKIDQVASLYSLKDSLLKSISTEVTDSEYVYNTMILQNTYRMLGMPDSSEYYFKLGTKVAYREDDELSIAHVTYFDGNRKYLDKKYLDAYKAYQSSYTYYLSEGKRSNAANVYLDIAKLFQEIEEYNVALDYLEKAERIANNTNNVSLKFKCSLLTGAIYSSNNNSNTAFHFYQQSLNIAETNNLVNEMVSGYYHIAKLHLDERDFETSESYIVKALKLCEEHNEVVLRSSLLTMMAFICNSREDYLMAVKCNEQALELRRNYGDVSLIGSGLLNLGATYFKLGDYGKTEEYLMEGLKFAQKYSNQYYVEKGYYQLHQLYEKTGNFKSSLSNLRKYISIKDSVNALVDKNELLKSRSKEEISEERRRIEYLVEEREIRILHTLIISAFLILLAITIGSLILYYRNKKLNKYLIQAKEEAENAADLKNQFLAQMSHEVRTPLNSIISFSNIIGEEVEHIESETIRESVRIVDAEINRILRTMELILDMAQIQSGNYLVKVVKIHLLRDIVNRNISQYKNEIEEKNLKLFVINNITNPFVWADRHSLEQIFKNLIDNAVKFTASGKIEVVVNRSVNNKVEVQIIDSGVGMSPEYMERIFEPFSQEEQGYSRKYEGNGLGLALVKKFCDLNRIEITIESKKHFGTSVILKLDEVI